MSGAGAAALAASATGHFVTFLETETHEGSLVLALEQLAAWAAVSRLEALRLASPVLLRSDRATGTVR